MEESRSGALGLLITASLAGFVLHQAFFRRVEVDKRPTSLAASFIVAYLVIAACFGYLSALFATACFLLSLWVNISVYRAFFHPLGKFPGPFPARLSKFWAMKKALESQSRWHMVAQGLHTEYGDYVRTGTT
jgi:hypothetical protein